MHLLAPAATCKWCLVGFKLRLEPVCSPLLSSSFAFGTASTFYLHRRHLCLTLVSVSEETTAPAYPRSCYCGTLLSMGTRAVDVNR